MASLPDPERCSRPWLASYPPGVPPTYRLPQVALPRLLDDAARDFPEHVALEYGAHTLTYADLREHVTALAAGLQTLPGDDPEAPLRGARVLVRVGDGFSGPVVLFALWQVGAVPVPVGLDVPHDVVAQLVGSAGVVGAIGDPWVLRRFPLPPLRFTIEVLDDEWHGRRLPRGFLRLPSRLDPRTWRRREGRGTRSAVAGSDAHAARPDAPDAGPDTPDAPDAGPDTPDAHGAPDASTADRFGQRDVGDAADQWDDPETLPADPAPPLRLTLDELLESGADRRAAARPAIGADAPALAVVQVDPSAGSSDAPDGAEQPTVTVHTHRTLLATAFLTRLWAPDIQAGRERTLVAEPMHDLVGSAVGLLTSVLSGATSILVDEDERSLGKTIERAAPTLLIARSPRMEQLLPEGEVGRGDLTSLRVCLLVGGGLHRLKAQELERRAAGARVRHLNGVSSAAPVTHGQPVYGRVDPRRFGLPVTSTVAMVVDPDDPTVERGVDAAGRLLVHGPQLPGEGWTATDLIASVDADGWFTVFGRDDEVVVVDGRPRSPGRITSELVACPPVREAAVIEVDGALVAAVALARRKRSGPSELRDALALHLDPRAMPDDIVVVDFLPRALLPGRDASGIDAAREELREKIRAARGRVSVHTGSEPDAAHHRDDPSEDPPSDAPPAASRPSS